MGSETAQITLVEFGDYQCSACRVFHRSLKAAERELGDSLAVVYRHLPLTQIHPMAGTAARAAECAAAQGKFQPYHERLFEDSSWLALGQDEFRRYAKEVGVPDSVGFSQCLLAGGEIAAVERDRAAALELGVAETPTMLINDRLIKGAVDSTTLIALIRQPGGKAGDM